MSVLIVDDTSDVRLLLSTTLMLEGMPMIEASSGPEVLEMLASGARPDVILLDVQMPRLDGWSVLKQIRRSPDYCDLRVIMCTVKNSVDDLILGWELGCDGYVSKPFDLNMVVSEIDAVTRRPMQDLRPFRARQVELLRSAS